MTINTKNITERMYSAKRLFNKVLKTIRNRTYCITGLFIISYLAIAKYFLYSYFLLISGFFFRW
jgi:hypothetical protein